MVKVNYFYQGFVGQMNTKKFESRELAEQFLEENKDSINTITANIIEI